MVPADHVFVVNVNEFFVDVEDPSGRGWQITVQAIRHCPVEEMV